MPHRDLLGADAGDAFLFLNGLAPIRARLVHANAGQTTFIKAAELAPATHAWTAPPLGRVEASAPTPAAPAQPIGAQIRKALTRKAPPASRTKAQSP